jgi:hypothetical protein
MHPARQLSFAVLCHVTAASLFFGAPIPQAPPAPRAASGLKGKLDYYTSQVDEAKRPYAICATSQSEERKPLVIVVSPGAPTDAGPNEIRVAEEYEGCVANPEAGSDRLVRCANPDRRCSNGDTSNL